MRLLTMLALVLLAAGHAAARQGTLTPLVPAIPGPGRLEVAFVAPTTDLYAIDDEVVTDVEGMASTIGGVRQLDLMLVLDTSMSLLRTDPEDYRTAGAVGFVESLSARSNTRIGVVNFDSDSVLSRPLTADFKRVVAAIRHSKRSPGTDIAAGIRTALDELQTNGRPEASRAIMLFTDGRSDRGSAREAALQARNSNVAIQTLLLGSDTRGAAMLEELASGTGGSFVQVTDPALLPDAFLNMRTTGVDHVMLRVNGAAPVPAHLIGSTFLGRLPLRMGENRIEALATSIDEQTKTASMVVNVHDARCATLEVAGRRNGRPAVSLDESVVEIVLDASRSMWGQLDGQSKMAIARDTLLDATRWIPGELPVALRAYGSESMSDERNCQDSTLLVPFDADSREPIRKAIQTLRPKGQTPIAFALEQAAKDFPERTDERTVVLVTDGMESCGGNPVTTARALKRQGITIHLIGFGLGNSTDEDAVNLRAIAAAGGGRFITAGSAQELKSALENTVGTSWRLLQDGAVVAESMLGANEPMLLPHGDYQLELDSVPPQRVNLSLAPRDQLMLTLAKDNGVFSQKQERTLLEPVSCERAMAVAHSMRGPETAQVSEAVSTSNAP